MFGEAGDCAFGAAADGSGLVEAGGEFGSAGQDELFEGWEWLGVAVDFIFELGDEGIVECWCMRCFFGLWRGRGSEGGADIEGEVLQEGEGVLEVVVVGLGMCCEGE